MKHAVGHGLARHEPVWNGHVVDVHRGDESEAGGVECVVNRLAVARRMVARIVAPADQPLIPGAGIEEHVGPRETHRGG